MILKTDTILDITTQLLWSPFWAPDHWCASVRRILEAGNLKHGDVRHSAVEHIEHARRHLQFGGLNDTPDPESGEPSSAHAAARLLLALLEVCKNA